MEKEFGKKAEQIIIRILNSSGWSLIDNVELASHEEDMMGIDIHYTWGGIKTCGQIKHISWWKDIQARRDTYYLLKETQKKHPIKYKNIRIIIYGFKKQRVRKGKVYPSGLNIYMIKKLNDVWHPQLEEAYQIAIKRREK